MKEVDCDTVDNVNVEPMSEDRPNRRHTRRVTRGWRQEDYRCKTNSVTDTRGVAGNIGFDSFVVDLTSADG